MPIPEFHRVMVTTDLSELGNRAVPYAYSILQSGGVVHIVHVEKPFEFASPIHAHHPTITQQLEEKRIQQIDECRTRLRSLIPVEAELHGILTEIEVLHEEKPAPAICEVAERLGVDVICMVSHGRSGISEAILGSVAHAVMISSAIPLLVIRPES